MDTSLFDATGWNVRPVAGGFAVTLDDTPRHGPNPQPTRFTVRGAMQGSILRVDQIIRLDCATTGNKDT